MISVMWKISVMRPLDMCPLLCSICGTLEKISVATLQIMEALDKIILPPTEVFEAFSRIVAVHLGSTPRHPSKPSSFPKRQIA
jgi:hypothetical protein